MHSSRRVRWTLIGLLCIFLLIAITSPFWVRWSGNYLVSGEPPRKSDIILVLGGDWTGQRILTAAQLAQQGFAKKVWVSGPMELYGVNEATLAINFAVEHGYPRSLFELKLIRAMSTREEAKRFKEEFQKSGIHSVLLVTSNFHSTRAGRIFRRVLGSEVALDVVSAPYEYYHPDTWWKSREDQKTWFFEWAKTVADRMGL